MQLNGLRPIRDRFSWYFSRWMEYYWFFFLPNQFNSNFLPVFTQHFAYDYTAIVQSFTWLYFVSSRAFFIIIITILWTDCLNTNDFSVFIVIKFPDFVFQIAVYRWFRSISDFLLITCHIIIQFTHTFFWNSYNIDVDRHRVNSLSCFAYASQACAQFKTIVILIALNNSSRKKHLSSK